MSLIFLRHGDEFVPMTEQPYEAEEVLQQLLAEHPEVLAGDTLGEARWLLVRREAGIADAEDAGDRWSLDHLFLDEDGIPTLVEVKRSSDTRARREVVAQMLDYAANATSFWRVERLQEWFEAECVQRGSSGAAELEAVFEITDPGRYWETVQTNLAADRIRLVFVADAISTEVRSIVEFLNRQMTETEVIALEVKQYVDADGERQTIVPRVIGQTESARRAKRPSLPSPPIDASPAFRELVARMDGVAAERGLTVRPGRTGRTYDPPRLEVGVTYTSGVGVFASSRGAEFNIGVFRELGADDVADDLLRRLRDITGVTPTARSFPAVPCETLIGDWERTRRDLIEPYFAQRDALATGS